MLYFTNKILFRQKNCQAELFESSKIFVKSGRIRDVRWGPGPRALRAGHGPKRWPGIIILARFSHGLIREGPRGLGPVRARA